jgi:hypothetical protein
MSSERAKEREAYEEMAEVLASFAWWAGDYRLYACTKG